MKMKMFQEFFSVVLIVGRIFFFTVFIHDCDFMDGGNRTEQHLMFINLIKKRPHAFSWPLSGEFRLFLSQTFLFCSWLLMMLLDSS